jgi:hypothetical protein
MFTDQLTSAIAGARSEEFDHLSRKLWAAHGAGAISDGDAQASAEAIAVRQKEIREARQPAKIIAPRVSLPRRRAIRSPDRAKSRQRRRDVGQERWLPPSIANKLTQGEIAVLSVIVREIVKHGVCSLPVDRIAGEAGVCATMVKNAQRLARALGWITIVHRPRRGQKSLTNLIYALNAELRLWLRTRRKMTGMTGGKKMPPTQTVERKADAPDRREAVPRWKR